MRNMEVGIDSFAAANDDASLPVDLSEPLLGSRVSYIIHKIDILPQFDNRPQSTNLLFIVGCPPLSDSLFIERI